MKSGKKKAAGYFTVEAALVMPIVLMSVVLVMYLFLFQYNRCLMEQDTGILALRGTVMQTMDKQERMRMLKEQANAQKNGLYLAWESEQPGLKLEKGTVQVERKGRLAFPFSGRIGKTGRVWETTAVCKNQTLSPVTLIRSYRRLTGGK